MKEFELIDWIRSQTRLDAERVPVGPGDDCAVVRFGGETLLATVDQVLDGRHLCVERDGHAAAGRKAMNRNLSDIAAMAGEPLCAVASVALPTGLSDADGQAIYRGLREAGEAFDCPVVGGDVAAWDHPLQISVTVLGRCERPVLRSGGRAGDVLCVTGVLGGGWRTRHHLEFTPRLAEAAALRTFEPRAMIDLSDGLAGDLRHLCRASGLGAELDAAAVPVREGFDLDAALCDGEDYELLFALPAEAAERLAADSPFATPVARIGRLREGETLHLLRDGERTPLPGGGWEHS